MRKRSFVTRVSLAASVVAAAATLVIGPTTAQAQQRPADLTVLPAVPTVYTPPKTSWGDYNFSHTYQYEYLNNMRILVQRPKVFGNRVWLTDEEFARRLDAATRSDSSFSAEGNGVNTPGTEGLGDFVKNSSIGHRTSLLVDPADGQLPPLTPQAEALYKAGRSGWVPAQNYDWVDDFDSWDRCVSRGFPASMFPFRYNNGVRIFQSPQFMTIQLEMLGTRVIPIVRPGKPVPHWPGPVEAWMGNPVGHWEGKTFVIETTNIKSGDSATHNIYDRAAAPLNMASQNVPPFNTIPTSKQAKTVERLTMTGPNSMTYEITYSDPEVFTKPWTARLEWARDDKYDFFEYACHEGDVQIRNYITASRARRASIAAGTTPANEPDDRATFARQFDYDPAANDRPAPPPRPGGGAGGAGGGRQGGGAGGGAPGGGAPAGQGGGAPPAGARGQ